MAEEGYEGADVDLFEEEVEEGGGGSGEEDFGEDSEPDVVRTKEEVDAEREYFGKGAFSGVATFRSVSIAEAYEHLQDVRSKRQQDGVETRTELFDKFYKHAEHFKRYFTFEEVKSFRKDLESKTYKMDGKERKLWPTEVSALLDLAPKSAEEVRLMIPSLADVEGLEKIVSKLEDLDIYSKKQNEN